MEVSKQILFAGPCDGVAAEVMELSGGDDGGKYQYDINTDIDTVMYHPTSPTGSWVICLLTDSWMLVCKTITKREQFGLAETLKIWFLVTISQFQLERWKQVLEKPN